MPYSTAPDLEIILFCHKFQRRLCWVLSSLYEQENCNLNIRVNIASLASNNGTPSTQKVAEFFRQRGLDIWLTLFERTEEIAHPSMTKNFQIRNSTAEWIMCHSADHVFPTNYFAEVEKVMSEYPDKDTTIGSGNKFHTDVEATNDAMTSVKPVFVENAYEQVKALPRLKRQPGERRPAKRPGGHIFFRRDAIFKKCDGYYCTWEQCSDKHLFKKFMRTCSDPGFRARMGGCLRVELPPLGHCNHFRGKDEKKYLDIQL